jgi:hypothetical protein
MNYNKFLNWLKSFSFNKKNMSLSENKDEYIIEDDGFSLKFKKNGKLHREEGPAILWKLNEDQYPNFKEKQLYKVKVKSVKLKDQLPILIPHIMIKDISDYLEGRNYTKKDFDILVDKLKLKKELNSELNPNQSNTKTKKLKI